MPLTGRVLTFKIKDEKSSSNIRQFTNVTLQLTTNKNNPKVIVQVPPDNESVYEFDLKDCNYLKESSVPGKIECIRIDSTQETLIIMDKNQECVELLKHTRDYLTGNLSQIAKEPSDDESEPIPNEKVNQLIRALNDNNADEAGRIARQLAHNNTPIRFALDMINESGNAAPRQPPPPVVKPMKLKLSIESFLIDHCTDQQYDVAILPETTIKDLKQIVERDANIRPNQQYWYVNREHLNDDYRFGVTPTPRVNENTVLTLYIAKPQNT